ncbi:MAG: hypothetical protein M3N93_02855 [Acidobacteriota bacterium]|nr:hypothetical protein [Acidobacteriota bacterium]
MRRQTSFDLTSYLMNWPDTSALPPHGPLVQAAMGAMPVLWGGSTAGTDGDATNIKFTTPHGLAVGQAITFNGEIRFVVTVTDASTIALNAPFSTAPQSTNPIGPTAVYGLASELPSVSLFDYWDPSSAVQRVFSGGAVDKMSVNLNGDFHEFEFKGMAQDVIDSVSFADGQGGATAFPAEPPAAAFDYSPIPGNLGQVWLGAIPNQFFTISAASVEISNNLSTRGNEYGSSLPQAISPGVREVHVTLEMFGQDDAATNALYQAARMQTPMSVMFQLGQLSGQLLGIYLPAVVPDLPQFDDADNRLKWKFGNTRAQGKSDDEITVAFG